MTNKATAKAHAMQGLLKYHGMKDSKLRIPYHDSISVCLDALFTKTTVEFGSFEKDELIINNDIQIPSVLTWNKAPLSRNRPPITIRAITTNTERNIFWLVSGFFTKAYARKILVIAKQRP